MSERINILMSAAVYREAEKFINDGRLVFDNGLYCCKTDFFSIDLILTGVGGAGATYYLTRQTMKKEYDFVLGFGVCGVYSNDKLLVGQMVCPNKAFFADLGFENRKNAAFLPLDANGISIKVSERFSTAFNIATGAVNTRNFPSTKPNNLDVVLKNFTAKYETMESAYCANVCRLQKKSYLELRCVSNTIEQNCAGFWNLSVSFYNLGLFLYDIFFGKNSETFYNFVKLEIEPFGKKI